ncbi:unnamed protein product, partial [Hapterophycus canaliculatus]
QAIARLALPRSSQLRPQAVGMLASFVATSPPNLDRTRSLPESRGRPGRWGGKVGRFGGGISTGATNTSRSPRFKSDGVGGEEGGALEASVASSSSSSSFADAASYVYSSLQALVSSGRDASDDSSPSMFDMAAGGGGGFTANHLPMAVLPQSLAEEAVRLSTMAAHRSESARGQSDPFFSSSETDTRTGNCDAGPRRQEEEASIVHAGDVAKMMLADGALEVFADAISPRLPRAEGKVGGRPSLPPLETESPEVHDGVCLRLEALEAAVSMLEGRPQAQADFVRLGGYSRICSFLHDAAASSNRSTPPQDAPSSCDPVAERSRSRSKSNTDRPPRGEAPPVTAELQVLDGAFDAVFRLALDGHAVARGARADGVDTVKTLLVLAARSPSLPVALRAARGLQALLRVRPMNAVSLERQSALRIVADAVSDLALSGEGNGARFGGEVPGEKKGKAEFGFEWDGVVDGRQTWSVDDKRKALSSMNEVVRVMAAVYSRRDARALEWYAGILLSLSTERFGPGSPGEILGARCSVCGAPHDGAAENALQRCLSERCKGAAGLCRACDDALHNQAEEDNHVRVPFATRMTCGPRQSGLEEPPPTGRADPVWALEAGKALMKAMAVMLDDRESFGLPPTPDEKSGSEQNNATAAEETPAASQNGIAVLASMLQVVQDELLEPLGSHRGTHENSREYTASGGQLAATRPPTAGSGFSRGLFDTGGQATQASCGLGWTGGWLLDALEIVARFVVRGDSKTVEELEVEGGWGLLAHISRLPLPPTHLATHRSVSPAGSNHGGGHEGRACGHTPTDTESGIDDESWHEQMRLSEAWVGWIGARRLSLWIIREALLTGTAGLCRTGNNTSGNIRGPSGTDLLVQPARWLVWLVRAVMGATLPSEDHLVRICSVTQARDQVLMKLAVLNELRLAIGSFAPCEVVMEGCTRVLPLVALTVARSESNMPLAGDEESGGVLRERPGVSPNRHPQARSGAANVKVVGRLAGDQRGVVLNALVSEGMMEVLLAIVQGYSSSPTDSSAAESGLALMFLADLASGSEKAKARLGSVLGYDILAEAAHAAGAAIHAHHYSLWLEASLRRVAGATARLAPPFERLVTDPRRALAVAFPPQTTRSLDAARIGSLRAVISEHEVEAGDSREVFDREDGERGREESRNSTRRRGWRRRSPGSRGGFKDGMAWVPRALPKLPHSLGRGGGGGRTDAISKAHKFDELWIPSGLVTLAQDVLLINRARSGVMARGEERYFIAQARGAPSSSGYPLWKLGASKFRGLEAAVFPFLLLPLVPSEHQPQAAEQLSRLLDANPANAAALCHLRVPLALLKLACLLPEQSQVRDLYFRLAAQLMSHHISPADALELFRLASLQPSAWARLGRLKVTSGASLVSARQLMGGAMVEDAVDTGDQICVRQGKGDAGVVMPPNSGELQMQLLYVIGTVVDSPSPAWFFHLDGGSGAGLVAGPLARFPPKRIGYSLSMWFRPAWFSGRSGGETALFSICGRKEDGKIKALLRVSLRRCHRPGDNSAPPAAAGIGASEDDDGDQGIASEDACAKLQPDVRCGRWQYLVLTHSYSSDAAGSRQQWMDGSVAVYVDGEKRVLETESASRKSKRNEEADHGPLAYPAAAGGSAGSISASVGCWEEGGSGGREPVAAPPMDPGIVSETAARFSGQIATVALVEGAWTAEMAKASFLRGPGAPPPGRRIVFASPGDLPPTPFLDAVGDVKGPSFSVLGQCTSQERKERELCSQGDVPPTSESRPVEVDQAVAEVPEGLSLTGTGSTIRSTAAVESNIDAAAERAGVPSVPVPGGPTTPSTRQSPLSREWDAPGMLRRPLESEISVAPPRLSKVFAPLRKAIDLKYGVGPADEPVGTGESPVSSSLYQREGGSGEGIDAPGGGNVGGVDSKSALLSDSMASTVNSLAVAAGCGGKDKDSACDGRVSFRLAAGSGTWVYATTPLHAAVQAAGGFRLCLPFLRMDHARQVAALRVLAGLLEASAEGMDAFRVRDGFNVLYHALAQGDHALEQLSMDTFDTLFELMTSEALQGALDVSASTLSPVTLLDATGRMTGADDLRASYLASGCVGVKPVRSPEALRLVVDLLGHCERKPDLQARMMEALVDALDGSSTGIQVWRRAFNESGAFAPLLYLLSPPAFTLSEAASASSLSYPIADVAFGGVSSSGGGGGGGGNSGFSSRGGLSLSRRSASFSMSSSGPAGIAAAAREIASSSSGGVGVNANRVSTGERPAVAAGAVARTQTARMLQVLIAGSAAVAPAVRPQDPSAVVASSTSAGCTPDQLADIVGFVLRCHLEVEELSDIVRLQVLNTGQISQDERFGVHSGRRAFAEGSAQSRLALTRQISRTVVDLLVQLCGGDGGAVLVGMMSQAFPAGGNFLVALELLSSSHVETRVSAIKLLSLMLVRKGNDSRRPSASTFFSTDDSAAGGGRPGPDPQALRAFEKLGGFAAMGRQLERHTTCQLVCDALMGMIFGVWGSKHEPRPIREKDVLAIKGNKESWLRAWWSSYSSPPDEDTTNNNNNPNVAGAATPATPAAAAAAAAAAPAPAAEGSSSIVDRFRSTAATATSGSAPATTASDQNGSEDDNLSSPAAAETTKGAVPASGAGGHDQDGGENGDGGMTAVTRAEKERGSNDGAPAESDGQNRDTSGDIDRTAVTTPPRSFLKPGMFAMKANVDT